MRVLNVHSPGGTGYRFELKSKLQTSLVLEHLTWGQYGLCTMSHRTEEVQRESGGRLELRAWRSGLASALSSYSCCFMSARFLGSKMVARSSVGEFNWCPWWDLTVRSMGEEDTPNRTYHGAYGDLVIPPLWARPRSPASHLLWAFNLLMPSLFCWIQYW